MTDPNDLPPISAAIEGAARPDSHEFVSNLRPVDLSDRLVAYAAGLRDSAYACSSHQNALRTRLSICAQLMDEAANALLNPPADFDVPAFLRRQAE